jgi:hypothetical protein
MQQHTKRIVALAKPRIGALSIMARITRCFDFCAVLIPHDIALERFRRHSQNGTVLNGESIITNESPSSDSPLQMVFKIAFPSPTL